MIRLPKILLTTVALSTLAACGGPPPSAPNAAGGPPKPGVAASTVNTPYAAIAAGKVDIEGGLVDVAARAPGIVKEVFVQEGDVVKANQVLARQEDDDARLSRNRVAAQLAQAEAQIPILEVQLAAAQREENRLARLIAEDATSQQLYEQAQDSFDPDALNVVVLASDGVANQGVTDADELTAAITEAGDDGIHLVTVGYGKPGICVDIHVHRITNRWGYIKTKTPEESEAALRKKLPKRYWITFNDLLVPYGQNLCQPVSPFCSASSR